MFSTSQSIRVCLAYFLDHDLVGLPTRYDQIDHSAIPELVCVDGWMGGCTNYKTQWQCPKSDREKTMLIVRQTLF
jgi:hypothetical protein